jgi:glycosyltransferase involved in cell wall biosynthesis
MRPLRVAYLPASLRPGGAEKQMLALAERLPRDRFRVDFLALSGAGEYDARARAAGARVRSLGSAPPPGARLPDRFARRALRGIRYAATARAVGYDIVDAWLYPADVLAALARPIAGTTVVVAGRRNLGDFHDRFGPLEQGIGALTNRLVDAVVANSDAVANDVRRRERLDPAKLHVIRNGVELIEPLANDVRAARRRELGVSGDEVLVGCVANYREVKRLDVLIDAFAALAPGAPAARLVLVGEGPLRDELQARIDGHGLDGHVRLHGSVPNPGLLYGAFDVIVQSSRSEGLPNAMLEAAAAGRPIVATDVGGTAEIVIDGRTGLLVEANDSAVMARALGQLVGDPALRGRLGSAAREHVARAFGMERFAAEFASLYEELAAAKHLLR